jgi:hypothetical protein
VAPVEQAVQQVQPVNVNISVRVDSPGDNGAVAQINAALSQPLPVVTPSDVRYQAPDQQYHDPLASNTAAGASPAPADPPPGADAPMTPVDSWDWTWTWSCGDVISPTIVLHRSISNRSGTGTGIGIAVETRTRMQIADRNQDRSISL